MSQSFWDREYQSSEHLALSKEPSSDLQKFCRFLERKNGRAQLNVTTRAVDFGCGNGRNLIFLAREYGMRGIGYDVSPIAIKQAQKDSEGLPIEYEARSIEGTFPLPDNSAMLCLDMMTSHFLKKAQREELRNEILRILKPGGWLFFKSFLADEDRHVARLLKESPADEEGAYLHPRIGVYEYAWREENLREFFEPYFTIHKLDRSHKHIGKRGDAWKRRTVSAYLEKGW